MFEVVGTTPAMRFALCCKANCSPAAIACAFVPPDLSTWRIASLTDPAVCGVPGCEVVPVGVVPVEVVPDGVVAGAVGTTGLIFTVLKILAELP